MARPLTEAAEVARPASPVDTRDARLASQRAQAAARAADVARRDVAFLRHDLRYVFAIAGLMLAAIIALSFVLH
ncbi:MAG TPA: hypothetical protein VMV93_08955 [Chloroflexota bacterium]|nr:hypothetical protein [Chloroflexota bacterium]